MEGKTSALADDLFKEFKAGGAAATPVTDLERFVSDVDKIEKAVIANRENVPIETFSDLAKGVRVFVYNRVRPFPLSPNGSAHDSAHAATRTRGAERPRVGRGRPFSIES